MSIVLNCLPCRCSHRKWERYRRSEVSTACHSICWVDTCHGTDRSRVRTAPISIRPVCCTSKFYSRWQDITHGCNTSTCLWSDIGHNNLICQRSIRGRRYCGCWSLRIIGTNKFAYYEVKSCGYHSWGVACDTSSSFEGYYYFSRNSCHHTRP